jgi:alpha-aminoadipic semialdehyde synthase
MDKHEWLREKVDAWRKEQSTTSSSTFTPDTSTPPDSKKPSKHDQGLLRTKRVLLLGSGMVAGPAVEKIAERSDVKLVVGECLSPLFLWDCKRFLSYPH